jgi:pyruvate dehydrogenase E2 component (dihydrolipoamide acetyltransferase)
VTPDSPAAAASTTVLPWRDRPPRRGDGRSFLSPAVRSLLTERDLDPEEIHGTGEGGRVTRADVLAYVDAREAPGGLREAEPLAEKAEIVPFSPVRRRTAEHMVRSKATAAHAAVVVEVDYESVARLRRRRGAAWREEEGFALTYLPFVARAVIDAIAAFPRVNASVRDRDQLVVYREVHLGVAIDLDHQGLIVPVVRNARAKRLRAIAAEIADLASRARAKQLSPDDVGGGTFTITNPGPYGTLVSVPIINQPQVAILATDRITPRPVVVETDGGDSVAVRAVGRLTLSFDHRAFDGAYAAAFLGRVRDVIETRPWDVEL